MSEVAILLPVSVEQIAAAILQMSPSDLDRLHALVPELHSKVSLVRTRKPDKLTDPIEKVRAWVMESLDDKPLSSELPFYDGLTLGEYLALPDDKQADLWDKWQNAELYDMEESIGQGEHVPA